MTLIRLTQAGQPAEHAGKPWWTVDVNLSAIAYVTEGLDNTGPVTAVKLVSDELLYVAESQDEVAALIRQANGQAASTTPDYASAHSWLNGFLEALATPGLEPMVSSAPEGVIVFEWRRPPYRIGAEIGQGAIEMYRVNTETEGPAEFATVGIGETTWDEIVAFVKGAES